MFIYLQVGGIGTLMETKIAKRLERIFQKNIRDNMAKSKNNNRAVTDEQVELYNTINPLINSIFKELKDFSKKNQNDPINLTKVKMINRLLVKGQIILKNEPSIDYLDLLEEDQLPSISDAVLIVSQYISALETFHSEHYYYDSVLGSGWDNPGHWK